MKASEYETEWSVFNFFFKEYTLFGYLRHYWTDKRFANKSKEVIQLKGSTIEHAWMPDTYISNSRQSNLRQKDSEAESTLFIHTDGSMFYSKGWVKGYKRVI